MVYSCQTENICDCEKNPKHIKKDNVKAPKSRAIHKINKNKPKGDYKK